MITTAFTERRELAHRTSDGIEVTLFWTKASYRITVAVLDARSDEALEFEVDGADALDAFKHPYAYAATGGADDIATPRGLLPRERRDGPLESRGSYASPPSLSARRSTKR
jgi:hypothetical protein